MITNIAKIIDNRLGKIPPIINVNCINLIHIRCGKKKIKCKNCECFVCSTCHDELNTTCVGCKLRKTLNGYGNTCSHCNCYIIFTICWCCGKLIETCPMRCLEDGLGECSTMYNSTICYCNECLLKGHYQRPDYSKVDDIYSIIDL